MSLFQTNNAKRATFTAAKLVIKSETLLKLYTNIQVSKWPPMQMLERFNPRTVTHISQRRDYVRLFIS